MCNSVTVVETNRIRSIYISSADKIDSSIKIVSISGVFVGLSFIIVRCRFGAGDEGDGGDKAAAAAAGGDFVIF